MRAWSMAAMRPRIGVAGRPTTISPARSRRRYASSSRSCGSPAASDGQEAHGIPQRLLASLEGLPRLAIPPRVQELAGLVELLLGDAELAARAILERSAATRSRERSMKPLEEREPALGRFLEGAGVPDALLRPDGELARVVRRA